MEELEQEAKANILILKYTFSKKNILKKTKQKKVMEELEQEAKANILILKYTFSKKNILSIFY